MECQHLFDGDQAGDYSAYLNNPFGVSLAQSAINTARELVGHRLALSVVGDDRGTRSGRSGSDSQSYTVSSGESDAAEVVGIVWVPLVPCIVGGLSSTVSEVDTSLQDRYRQLAFELSHREGITSTNQHRKYRHQCQPRQMRKNQS